MKPQQKQGKKDDKKDKQKGGLFSSAVPAVVEEVVGRTGTRGAIIQVRARVMDGKDRNKVLRRNVRGAIREKDVIMLRETEIEARSLSQGGKRGKR